MVSRAAVYMALILLSLSTQAFAIPLPTANAQSSFTFDSIQSVVDIVSPRLAHVTRVVTIQFAAGNTSSLDWGLWYQGETVQVTTASDPEGKLSFIYPLPGSDPTKPSLRILFRTTIGSNQPYTFTYQYDVTGNQDSLAWAETFDASNVLIKSLTITITLPANYEPTGIQPSSATQTQENGRTVVTWYGSNIFGVSNVGLTVGFQQTTSSSLTLSSVIPYAAAGVSILGVLVYGFNSLEMKRRKKRTEPYIVLESQAKQAASETPRPTIATGVPPLDYLLNGGLPTLGATVITAPACDERDIILRKILEAGAKGTGVSVYLGKDLSKVEDLLETSSGLQILVTKVEGVRAERPQVHLTDKADNLNGMSIDLMSLLQTLKTENPRLLCVDIVDDLLLIHKSTVTRRWLSTILSRVKTLGFTVVTTLNPQMHSSADVQIIVDLFEGHIQLAEKPIANKPKIVMRVQKMSRWKVIDSEAVLDRNKL